MFQHVRKSTIAIAALMAFSMPATATPITSNTGWEPDNLSTALTNTDGSPFTFSLSAGQTASFKVTDQFLVGDSFELFSGANLLASSTLFAGTPNAIIGDPDGESGWLDGRYEKFDYVFSGAGNYSFNIVGDGGGGVPAGLYVRLDVTNVPEPASLALLGLGLAGLAAARRRKPI